MEKEECIFCELAKKKQAMVYEDDICFAVPDKYPSNHGHMLVISKEHHENILETPDEIVSHMFVVSKKLAQKVKDRLKSEGIFINTNTGKEAGQIIFHFHIHVNPKYAEKRKGFMPHKELTDEEAKYLHTLLKP